MKHMNEPEKIVDRCPSCGGPHLFIGVGGYLTCSWLKCPEPGVGRAIDAMKLELQMKQSRIVELEKLINNPHTEDFLKSVQLEAAHQIERWGKQHDDLKKPEDWLWVAAYLATKASQAHRYGDREKYLHHIITTAALCLNWHKAAMEKHQNTELEIANIDRSELTNKEEQSNTTKPPG